MAAGWHTRPRPVLRAGTNYSPPHNFLDPSGQPSGFAGEVLSEAARRAGYQLHWVPVQEGPDGPLTRGEVDIWPYVTVTQERKQSIHLTSPWWSGEAVLLYVRDRPVTDPSHLAGKRLAYSRSSRKVVLESQWPPGMSHVPRESASRAAAALCDGEADAVWMDLHLVNSILLSRPRACQEFKLAYSKAPRGSIRFAIGASAGRGADADRIRRAIDSLAADGFLMAAASKWDLFHRSDVAMVGWLMDAQSHNAALRTGLATAFVLLLAVTAIAARARAAKATAERATSVRSVFLANMSHELRTPMNGILGMLDLTLSSPLSTAQQQQLTVARESAHSLLAILNDILDFSRIDSGKLPVESIPFALRQVAGHCAQLLNPLAQSKNLDLSLHIAPETPEWVIGDPVRVRQILLNLLSNAVKFTERGAVRASLTCVLRDGAADVCFAVDDTGIGIPKEKLAHIFESFTQADASITRRYGGSGLGLAISQRLARLMGGSLRVSSQRGVGSHFELRLPFPIAQAPATDGANRLSTNGTGSNRHEGAAVLLAEDNHINQLVATRILENAGYRVQVAKNGIEAVQACEESRFDLALLDIQMPEMGGMEAIARIRERERETGAEYLPVIALTAHALPADRERFLAAGMNAYVSKPIDSAELIAAIERLLDAQDRRRETAGAILP
ncbi:MAG: response regulator [Bryobacterales bacterium]|nr:response regulator [Bryobacterales bacterium]